MRGFVGGNSLDNVDRYLGSNSNSVGLRTGLWLASLGDSSARGWGLAMNIGTQGLGQGSMYTAVGVIPQAGMSVRCSRHADVINGGVNYRAKTDKSVLYRNEVLVNGDKLQSKNKIFEAEMIDGNLIIKNKLKGCNNKWQTGTSGASNTLSFQTEGNLVVTGTGWNSGTTGRGGIKLEMQDDGNLVMYDDNNIAVWASGTPEPVWDNPSADNTLLVGEQLNPSDYLISNNKKYKLYFQGDQNVVLYASSDNCTTRIFWATVVQIDWFYNKMAIWFCLGRMVMLYGQAIQRVRQLQEWYWKAMVIW
jgi:hypothetical protein